jgi:membrane fusion protein, multidrug efflux system
VVSYPFLSSRGCPVPAAGLSRVAIVGRAITMLGAALALSLLAGCSKPAPAEDPVRAVKLLTLADTPAEAVTEFSGEIRPRVETRLSFRVAGKITARPVGVGDRVRRGQVLAEVDPQDYRLAVSAVTQRDLAQADLAHFAALKSQGFISGAELERREATLKAAQAAVDQAQTGVNTQTNQASYTRLIATENGVVVGVDAEPGQVVAAGTPVLRVAQDGPRDAVFVAPEQLVGDIRMGSAVQVRQWAGGEPVQGRVREVAAAADPVTRTFAVRVALAPSVTWPLGATVVVKPQAVQMGGTPVLRIPSSALLQASGQSKVWLFDPATQTVQATPVEVAGADGNWVVLAGGLRPGQQIVSAGVHVLQPGQKVTVYQAPGTAAAPTPSLAAPAASTAVTTPQAATKTVAN